MRVSPGLAGERDGATVRRDDRLDKGQTEADAALAASRRVAAGEPLEGDRQQVRGEARAVVADLETVVVHGDGHGGAGGRVLARVGQQVGDDLVKAGLVPGDLDRYGVVGQLQLPPVVGREDPRVLDGLEQEAGEVDRLLRQRPAAVETGEEQEVLDQRRHPGGFLLDLGQCGLGRSGILAAARQLGVADDRRQRRPQLVARVGHELAHLLLAPVPRVERRLDVGEQGVERLADLADLGVGVGEVVGDPRQITPIAPESSGLFGHRVRRRRDLGEGAELAAHDHAAADARRGALPVRRAQNSHRISESTASSTSSAGRPVDDARLFVDGDPVGPVAGHLDLVCLAIGRNVLQQRWSRVRERLSSSPRRSATTNPLSSSSRIDDGPGSWLPNSGSPAPRGGGGWGSCGPRVGPSPARSAISRILASSCPVR